ncbi:molecular chaperone [Magnetospirillum sp. ME-1]|uniref:Hsp70 family protein n=1 Tax=Magnetospirillum sp. ME-1 TaxID=1639348 RepID=UPI000A17AF70|nr:Hsp70 family protein [Magnetospirillum sp. ME-1]ARJ67565.1 molecular chaperone [Magnetospirillum sp. ME-1]
MFVGMDFGTTNSAVALAGAGRDVEVLDFVTAAGPSSTLRSVLAFENARRDAQRRIVPLVGHDAIEAYVHGDGDCRFLQSFKSYLTSRSFTSTAIYGKAYALEDLVALIVARLRQAAVARGGQVERVVAGRPVRFVAEGGEQEDAYATGRLVDAFARAGIGEVAFEYEPIAAAYYYESTLRRDQTVLVADFGGGTSDFCLIRLGPGRAGLARPEDAIIGTAGLGLAGDAFDRRIVEHGISDQFGKRTTYASDGKILPMPAWVYAKLERWHHVAFLNTPSTLRMLRDLKRHVEHPDQLEMLLDLIEHNLGYHLYRSVEQAKRELSLADETVLRFDHDPVVVERRITRAEFEGWIGKELAAIEACVDGLLDATGTGPAQVDRVFLTGGSSLVPAVRAIFARHFGEDRLSAGGEFISVATGLAQRARELFG